MLRVAKRAGSWPSAVVFDLDGTLVDSAGDLAAALNELLASAHVTPFGVDEVVDFIGNGIAALVQRALAARGLRVEVNALAAHVARFEALYAARATRLTRPFAGVPELIMGLHARGAAVGICTNKEERLARRVVEGLGLQIDVDAVVGGRPGRPAKPSAVPLLETIARLGASPADAIMVGDSEIDMHCATNAGVRFIGVTFGYCRPPMARLGADITIASYDDFDDACGLLQDMPL
jgi:phosphoglycolate phosphatase